MGSDSVASPCPGVEEGVNDVGKPVVCVELDETDEAGSLWLVDCGSAVGVVSDGLLGIVDDGVSGNVGLVVG